MKIHGNHQKCRVLFKRVGSRLKWLCTLMLSGKNRVKGEALISEFLKMVDHSVNGILVARDKRAEECAPIRIRFGVKLR